MRGGAPLAAVAALLVAAAAQDESQNDSNGLQEEAQGQAYGQMGPDADDEQVWYGEDEGWLDEQGQAWYQGQDQGWYDQGSFNPLPQDFGSDQWQYYPPEQQPYWAPPQPQQDQVSGFSGEWSPPDETVQPPPPPYAAGLSAQQQPYIPEMAEEELAEAERGFTFAVPVESMGGEPAAGSASGFNPYQSEWYSPMAPNEPMVMGPVDWDSNAEYPNQWYNVDPYGPVPNYNQDPCEYMYEYYYDDCNSGAQVVPKCEESVCLQSCKSHFGYNEGACFNNECYCRNGEANSNLEMDWTHEDQKDWPSEYPECAISDVHQQSPVDIEAEAITSLSKKLFFNPEYRANMSFVVRNTGHGLRHYVQAKSLPAVQVMTNQAFGRYVLGFIDFHWNISEHYVLGKPADVEAQLHHFDLNYDTYEEAAKVPGALLSIAILFQSDPSASDLDDRLFPDSILKPDKAGEVVTRVPFPDLGDNQEYGSYRGTLTYPPCTRNVNWLVSKQVYRIRADQIEKLQEMEDPLGRKIVNNSRRLKGQVGAQ